MIIRQGKEENYRPELYVEAAGSAEPEALGAALRKALNKLAATYPGLDLKNKGSRWQILISEKHRTDHEAHFGQVMEKFLTFLADGKLPRWETPNTIAKYHTTIQALKLAQRTSLTR